MSENNKKIKSVTFKEISYQVPNWEVEVQGDGYIRLYTPYTSFWFPKSEVKIEYEKPKQYFNKNGSVQVPLEANQKYWYIGSYGRVYDDVWKNHKFDFYMLKTENVFITREDAQRALDQKNKGLNVLEKLKEINRENDWVENFDGDQDHYYVGKHKDSETFIQSATEFRDQGIFHFCKEASDYLNSLPKEDKGAFFNLNF